MDDSLDFQPDFTKLNGLMPVVVQDAQSQEVLMLAYANREALSLTQKTGLAHYYSRSRGQLWQKGESSGHIQKVCEIWIDCDQDTLLYLVEQQGPACHTGRKNCFYRKVTGQQLEWSTEIR
jgi:phosphoribosyl-AMP cyclohydrolase